MAQAMPATGARAAKLFRNNRSQAVRIPAEFEMPGTTVLIHKVGDKLVIEPEPRADLASVLRSLSPLGPEDQLPDDFDEGLVPLRSVDL
jgi:antitoxin VapB